MDKQPAVMEVVDVAALEDWMNGVALVHDAIRLVLSFRHSVPPDEHESMFVTLSALMADLEMRIAIGLEMIP